ncbi:hypothetical protein FRC12_008471 [Ceratobasidium sp. 428]|nr:hypothetical protein FRC12_008471 [Ceratobasidium sp. 428]
MLRVSTIHVRAVIGAHLAHRLILSRAVGRHSHPPPPLEYTIRHICSLDLVKITPYLFATAHPNRLNDTPMTLLVRVPWMLPNYRIVSDRGGTFILGVPPQTMLRAA